MTDPSILTIILNFRTPEMTLKSAEAALRAMEGVRGEVIVVDNGSEDGSYRMIVEAAQARGWLDGDRLRVVDSGRNGGFGAGMNFGMRCGLSDGSRPDFFYLLNSDAFPEPDAIRTLRDFLLANPGAGMVGSHVRGPDAVPHCTAFRFPTIAGEFETGVRTGVFSRLLSHAIVALPIPERPTQVDWTAGASLMMSAAMLDEIGGFDEIFFLYYEETDLCLRAARAGWRTHYLPASAVVHVGSASTGMKTWTRTPSYWFDSRLHYFTKNHGRFYAAMATLARIAGCSIWRLRCLIQNKPRTDPEYFLRDLIAHALRAPFRRSDAGIPLSAPLAEDKK